MKFFLTAFGLYNPFAGLRLQPHGIIPVASEALGGLDLDYSSILVAESFIIDRLAYDYVRDQRDRFLGPMFKSLTVLEDEGMLEVVDFSEPIVKHRDRIVDVTSRLLDDVRPWLDIGREHWRVVKREFEDFGARYSKPNEKLFDTTHYGILSHLERRNGSIDVKELERLNGLLESRRQILNKSEMFDVRRILEPLVAQVVMNDLLRRWLNTPFLDWDDAEPFYGRLYLLNWEGLEDPTEERRRLVRQSRRLFSAVIPELLPGRIEDVIKFLRNTKAVRSLRSELWACLRRGEDVSPEWMTKLREAATRAKLVAERKGRIIKWLGRAVGLFVPGGTTAVEVTGDLLIAAAEDAAEATTNSPLSRFEWYYALQKIKSI